MVLFQTLKTLVKLSRKMAIFEFSSLNGYSSFNLIYECRSIRIREIEDVNQSQFSYVVELPLSRTVNLEDGFRSDMCEKRGFEEFKKYPDYIHYCITNFQGKKYSRI